VRSRAEVAGVALALLAALAASVAAPLATYVVTLALFGLPHVLVELRYVDERFGGRIAAGRSLEALAVLLAALVAVTALVAAGVHFDGEAGLRLGLLIPMVLVAVVAAGTARGLSLRLAAALGVTALCTVGIVRDPFTWLVGFACLHNLSPLLFLAERLGRRGLWIGLPVFVAVPALVLLASTGVRGDAAALPASWHGIGRGSLLAAFVPDILADRHVLGWFRACVFLQCAHYVFVLWVLPRLGAGADARPVLAWPSRRAFGRGVLAIGALGALAFVADFGAARSHYAIPAAVHAWIEVPLLVLAVTWTSRPGSQPSCSPS
jgi:hypothetical protein